MHTTGSRFTLSISDLQCQAFESERLNIFSFSLSRFHKQVKVTFDMVRFRLSHTSFVACFFRLLTTSDSMLFSARVDLCD